MCTLDLQSGSSQLLGSDKGFSALTLKGQRQTLKDAENPVLPPRRVVKGIQQPTGICATPVDPVLRMLRDIGVPNL